MIWILRALNISLILLNIWFLFYNIETIRIIFILIGFLFLISGLRKAFIIGLDNLRGRFWVLLSLNGLVFPISEIFNSEILHLLSRVYLILVLLFMFLGLKRQGFELKGNKVFIWLVFLSLSILLSFLFLTYIPNKSILTYLFLIVLNINFAILLLDVLLYLGSDLGKRWFIGFIGFAFFFIGDPLYLINNNLHYFFWCFIFFFINIVSHLEE